MVLFVPIRIAECRLGALVLRYVVLFGCQTLAQFGIAWLCVFLHGLAPYIGCLIILTNMPGTQPQAPGTLPRRLRRLTAPLRDAILYATY
jgi:hypothetical protein